MFQDIDADLYVMVDGDDTYDASLAPKLVERLIEDRLDMVVGKRIETHTASCSPGPSPRQQGADCGLVRYLFRSQLEDITERLSRVLAPLREGASVEARASSRSRPS